MSPTSLINLNVDRLSDDEGAPYGASVTELAADVISKRKAYHAASAVVASTQDEMITKEIEVANALDALVAADIAFDQARRSAA